MANNVIPLFDEGDPERGFAQIESKLEAAVKRRRAIVDEMVGVSERRPRKYSNDEMQKAGEDMVIATAVLLMWKAHE